MSRGKSDLTRVQRIVLICIVFRRDCPDRTRKEVSNSYSHMLTLKSDGFMFGSVVNKGLFGCNEWIMTDSVFPRVCIV